MTIRRDEAATIGWSLIAGFVLVWDLLGYVHKFELLTTGWQRWLAHPRKRWGVGLAWLLTTKHLFFKKFIPWLDPFNLIGWAFQLFNHQRSAYEERID